MPDCRIKPLENPDAATVAELLDLWEGSVRATHDFLRSTDIAALRRIIPAAFGVVSLYAARAEDGRLLGFSGLDGERLEMLFVRDGERGRGVGKALLRHALDLGVTSLDVNEQNPAALAFYQHLGFVVTGRSELDGQGNPFPLLHMHLAP